MSTNAAKKVINTRLSMMFFLGLSSGLPLALTSTTLQAWFTQANISLMTIGALSLLGLPYTIKFLWAPILDHYRLPFLHKRQGWMLLMQLILAMGLFVLGNMNPSSQANLMGIVALLIAFFSASFDISVDAYRTDLLLPEERGLGLAYFVFAYRMALLLAGGVALVLADYLGFQTTYNIMGVCLLLNAIPTYFSPQVLETQSPPQFYQTVSIAFLDLFQRDKIALILLFVILYKFGDALALSLITNFLMHGLGFSLSEIGVVYKVVSLTAVILGGFVGGLLLIRLPLFHALLLFGLAQSFSNLTFVWLALAGKHFPIMAATVFIENFCSGMSTAAFLAFLTSLCNQRFSASQYALLSAIASLGRVFLGPVAALMVDHFGWVQFFVWSTVLCFPGLFVLLLLKDKVMDYAHAALD